MTSTNSTQEKTVDLEMKMQSVDLNAWFGAKQALKNINIGVKANAVTAIIGPSGCGKSTFIRCLNRMHELTPNAKMTGQILLDGRNIYDKQVDPVMVRRRVGMVFQKPNPFPTMSIYDNVAAGFKLNGNRDRRIIEDKVEKSLKMAALWEEVRADLHKPGTSLSGG